MAKLKLDNRLEEETLNEFNTVPDGISELTTTIVAKPTNWGVNSKKIQQ
jgi:hypothetical protein